MHIDILSAIWAWPESIRKIKQLHITQSMILYLIAYHFDMDCFTTCFLRSQTKLGDYHRHMQGYFFQKILLKFPHYIGIKYLSVSSSVTRHNTSNKPTDSNSHRRPCKKVHLLLIIVFFSTCTCGMWEPFTRVIDGLCLWLILLLCIVEFGTAMSAKRVDTDLYKNEAPTVDILEDGREENFRLDINSWTLNKHNQKKKQKQQQQVRHICFCSMK